MAVQNTNNCMSFFDKIIESRRSIRSFKDDIPPKDAIMVVIRAGLFAPYAGVLDPNDFRRFVIIQKDSSNMIKVKEMMKQQVKSMLDRLKLEMQQDPSLQNKSQKYSKLLEMASTQGIGGVGTAPYFIVVAERKAFPAVEQQSLAHCLQNMWLKATALDLGFQLVSATAMMAKEKEFLDLLGISFGEFEINGCAIGYPSKKLPPAKRQNVEKVTKWLD